MYGERNVVFTIISPIKGSNNNYISFSFARSPYHTTPIVGNVALSGIMLQDFCGVIKEVLIDSDDMVLTIV
jgi:hypothetical protein